MNFNKTSRRKHLCFDIQIFKYFNRLPFFICIVFIGSTTRSQIRKVKTWILSYYVLISPFIQHTRASICLLPTFINTTQTCTQWKSVLIENLTIAHLVNLFVFLRNLTLITIFKTAVTRYLSTIHCNGFSITIYCFIVSRILI